MQVHNMLTLERTRTVPPWWQAPKFRIAKDSTRAIKQHNGILKKAQVSDLIVYTDGSDIQDRVGAAAYSPTHQLIRQSYAGHQSMSTVYVAELIGIQLALAMAKEAPTNSITIFTDNQAAVRAVACPARQSGQYVIRNIIRELEDLQQRQIKVCIRWVPAHIGIQGNEEADRLAKQATGWREKGAHGLPAPTYTGLRQLQSSAKRLLKAEQKRQWLSMWDGNPAGKHYKRKHLARPGKDGIQLHRRLTKPLSAVLIQLRSSKIGLNQYLYSIRRADTMACSCGTGNQTVTHVLCECEHTRQLRFQLFRKGTVWDARAVLNDAAEAGKAALLTVKSGLLGQFKEVNPLLIEQI